jgi:hypothetical protein
MASQIIQVQNHTLTARKKIFPPSKYKKTRVHWHEKTIECVIFIAWKLLQNVKFASLVFCYNAGKYFEHKVKTTKEIFCAANKYRCIKIEFTLNNKCSSFFVPTKNLFKNICQKVLNEI